ncbi:BamA/TamA family outer membrane protein [Algibacter sp. L4_22]|uniref:translocation and assembly module lipoprotein TamL n=1 Tax=Algibacter sp. L4_22 TaxID=2942477 RepID=UPI00201B8393|nr:BamA/TamA family outer membrane protein [Algibacter sp. L4_22]MCL5130042.1 BamA/TamA family outer membrane protein [Algibacter sp. L4_22]
MKLQFNNILISLVCFICITACDSLKRVAEEDHVLSENTILVNGKKENTEILNNLLYQKPNTKIPILGVPLRLHVYNLARPNIDSIINADLNKRPNKKKHLENFLSKKQLNKYIESKTKFNAWLKKTGEAPIIVNELKTKKSIIRLNDYYINNGWLDVKTDYDITKTDDKRAKIEYQVETGEPFIIDTITPNIKSPIIDTIYQKIKKDALIKHNDQYRTVNFEQERERIATEIRNSGVYHFSQDYITMDIDTIGTNKKMNVGILIQDRAIKNQDSITRVPFKIYTIRDVNIITDYSFENRDKPFLDSIKYNGYNIYAYDKIKYRPRALTDAMFTNAGTIFKDLDRTRTYRHLNELRTFKYPNIEYYEHEDNTLTDTIRLTPLKKFNFGFSTDVSQSNIQNFGFSLSPSLQIRNIFRGAETFEISGIASIGSSKDKNDPGDPFFDINEYGLDLKLTIPRLFSPFYTERIIPKYMSPSTSINLSTTSQTNIGLDKETFSGAFSFKWQPNSKVTDKLDIFNMQYINNLNIKNYFRVYTTSFTTLNNIAQEVGYVGPDEELNIPNSDNPNNQADEFIAYALADTTPSEISSSEVSTIQAIDERKTRLTENNLILSSSFSFTKDGRTNIFDENFSIFKFKLEAAGNILASASDFIGLKKDDQDRYELLGVAFSQYLKTELDYTKHWDLGTKNVIAMRSFLGIAVPYGNSTSIPFSKSFYAGGPNDNRAWSAYGLGPGSSQTTNEFNEANLKIAFNLEHRFNLIGNLNAAFFIDAGNIWNVFDDVETEGATFDSFSSLKDIAVGSGTGLRYDFSFFVFRFDVGFKTYNPSNETQNRWFQEYNFSNAVYNIGINYPF